MNVRAICEGAFTLPLPIAEAMPLFTPEGERPWAGASWDPVYAIPDAVQDDSAPGTVFTTEGAGSRATWIVLDRSEHSLRYAHCARPDRRHDHRRLLGGRFSRRDAGLRALRRHVSRA